MSPDHRIEYVLEACRGVSGRNQRCQSTGLQMVGANLQDLPDEPGEHRERRFAGSDLLAAPTSLHMIHHQVLIEIIRNP